MSLQSLLLAAYYNWHGPNFWYTATVGVGYGEEESRNVADSADLLHVT